jgi:uncharacterized membrane protein
MKQPILLKTVLDICFILLAFGFTGGIIASSLALIKSDPPIPITINGNELTEISAVSISLLVLQILTAGITLFTIFLLRKLVRTFFKGVLYTSYQIKTLDRIGRLVITVTLLTPLLEFLSDLFIGDHANLGIHFNLSFTSFWFLLAMGLFFIYLSKVFENARILKEENQLTV